MLFNSFHFIFWFWPVVCVGFYLLSSTNDRRGAKLWLLLFSLAFYGWMKFSNLYVLIPSILFNWFLSQRIVTQTDATVRKKLLWIALGTNILFLATFKYANAVL